MKQSRNKFKGVPSNYSIGLSEYVDTRSEIKRLYEDVLSKLNIINLIVSVHIIIIILIPTISVLLFFTAILFILLHRSAQAFDIANRLPVYVKQWWPVTTKIKIMIDIADGVAFIGNKVGDKNQEIWDSVEQQTKHQMVNTGTGGGKTTSILSQLWSSLGNSGQTTVSEAKGDNVVARKYINILREFGVEDDVYIASFATSNTPTEKGYLRSHGTNLFAGNDAAAVTEIILGLLPSESSGGNKIFVERASVLAKNAILLIYEKEKNTKDLNYRVTLQEMQNMLNLDQILKALKEPWLKSESVRNQIVEYLGSIQITDPLNTTIKTLQKNSNKTIEQHMFGQLYFTKGISTLTNTYGYMYNKKYSDFQWSDIFNRRRHIYQLIPAIEKSSIELEYNAKIHTQVLLNAIKTLLNPRIQGRSYEVGTLEHVDLFSNITLDEFTFLMDEGIPKIPAQVRSLGVSFSVYMQSMELSKEINKEVILAIQGISGILVVGQTQDKEARQLVIDAAGQTLTAKYNQVELKNVSSSYFSAYKPTGTLNIQKEHIFNHEDIANQEKGYAHIIWLGCKDGQTGNPLAHRVKQFYLGSKAVDMMSANDDIVLNHHIEEVDKIRPKNTTINMPVIKINQSTKKEAKPISVTSREAKQEIQEPKQKINETNIKNNDKIKQESTTDNQIFEENEEQEFNPNVFLLNDEVKKKALLREQKKQNNKHVITVDLKKNTSKKNNQPDEKRAKMTKKENYIPATYEEFLKVYGKCIPEKNIVDVFYDKCWKKDMPELTDVHYNFPNDINEVLKLELEYSQITGKPMSPKVKAENRNFLESVYDDDDGEDDEFEDI